MKLCLSAFQNRTAIALRIKEQDVRENKVHPNYYELQVSVNNLPKIVIPFFFYHLLLSFNTVFMVCFTRVLAVQLLRCGLYLH